MSNCIPCPPCENEIPLTCEPYGTVSTGNRVVVEDDAFCTKTLSTPSTPSVLSWDNGIKWKADQCCFNEFTDFTATGTTEARDLVTRFAELINVKDFGAKGDGIANDSPSIQAAINSSGTSGLVYFPKGTYRLDSNVSTTGKLISYIINPEVNFIGFGNLNNPTQYGYFYGGQSKDTKLSLLKQDDKAGATATFIKYSSAGNTSTFQNPALFAVGYKNNTDTFARIQGIYAEGIDNVGGAGSFVEGARFAGISEAPQTSAANFAGIYGTITYAQGGFGSTNRNWSFCVGIESEVQAWHDAPSPSPRNFNPNRFSAGFLATCRSGQPADVAFATNCFTEVDWKAGFVVEKSVNAGKVSDVAFGCYQTDVVYGLDLAKGSYTFAAIAIPNNSAIRAFNAAGTFENNIMSLGGSNVLGVGVDVDIAHTETKSILPAVNNTYTLGSNTPRVWSNIYSQNPVTVVSDLRHKKDIQNSVLGLEFINKLRPVSYKFIEGGNKVVEWDDMGKPTKIESIPGARTHFGLIAQEVKESLPEGVDFGGWVLSNTEDASSPQALRYEQFIAPLIKSVQELASRVMVLENN